MSDQDSTPEQNTIEQTQGLENDLHEFFKKNQGSAFTLRALNNRIDNIITEASNLEYAKENLQSVLDKMRVNNIINVIQEDSIDHYLIKLGKELKAQKEVIAGETRLNLEPIKLWINKYPHKAVGWSILFGLLIGLLSFTQYLTPEILMPITILVITISVIGEIITFSNRTKKNRKYSLSIYGIIALISAVIGVLSISNFWQVSFHYLNFGTWQNLLLLLLAALGIISGAVGIFRNEVEHAALSIGGIFLGGILLAIVLFSLIYLAASFLTVFFV